MSGNIPYGLLIPLEGPCRILLSCHLEGLLDVSALSQLLYDLIIVSYFLGSSLSYDFMRSVEIPLNKFIHFLVPISPLATERRVELNPCLWISARDRVLKLAPLFNLSFNPTIKIRDPYASTPSSLAGAYSTGAFFRAIGLCFSLTSLSARHAADAPPLAASLSSRWLDLFSRWEIRRARGLVYQQVVCRYSLLQA